MTAAAAGVAAGRRDADAAFAALRERFRSRGYYRHRPLRGMLEYAASYAIMLGSIPWLLGAETLPMQALALVASTYGMVAVATNCHTASHRGITGSRVDAWLMFFGFALSFGMSTTYWTHSHVKTHHVQPNVVGVDDDADLAPWFVLNQDDVAARSRGWQRYYRVQWLVFPLALSLNLFSIQLTGLQFLAAMLRDPDVRSREHWLDAAFVASHWIVWLALPLALFDAGAVLGLYALRMAAMGYGLFVVVAPHHYPAEAACVEPDAAARSDFVLLQTSTCLDFRSGRLGYLYCHGADHQIEHHLFPEVPHVYYARMQAEVEAFCRTYGYPYRRYGWVHSVAKAYGAIVRPKPVVRDMDGLRVPADAGISAPAR